MTEAGHTGWKRWSIFLLVVAGAIAASAGEGVALDGVVSDIDVGPAVVFPAFDEDTHDYGIRCGVGTNAIDVTVQAPAATGITIDGNPASSGATVSLAMVADDAAVVAVTVGASTDEYWYRCLPDDYPTYAIDRPGTPGDGFYFVSFGLAQPGAPPQSPFVAILDTNGVPVWYKRARIRVIDQKLLADGTLAWMEFSGPSADRSYEIRTLDGALLGHRRTVGQATDNHDYLELANGNIMLMAYPTRSCVDLTALGLTNCETAIDGYLQEIDPATGALVWEWRSQEHIPVSDRALGPGTFNVADLVHLNSVDEFADGDLLVSARSAGVYRIDRATGAVEWKLGGTESPARLTTIGDPFDGTWRQHDARVLDDDTISVYDNQSGRSQARAVVFDVDVGNGTATLVWEKLRGEGLDSPFIGAHRVQPDGNSVITWGGLSPFFEEVDSAGNRELALILDTQREYRVVKYGAADLDLTQLRPRAGGALAHDAPTNVVAVAGDRQATVSWTAPTIGSPTGYLVTASPGGATCATGGGLSCSVPQLDPLQAYTFSVTADNSFGGSVPSLPSNPVVVDGFCNGEPVTVNLKLAHAPGPSDDVILGTPGADVIVALGGDDTICAQGGADTVNAGPGADWVDAGSGDDIVFGQDGDDTIGGGLGQDQLLGFANNDIIDGGAGADVINGGPGNDTLDGGDQDDQIYGQGGNDTINAGPGADFVIGVDGLDTINGEAGNDTINGGSGSDTISGGADNDTIYGSAGDDPQLDGDGGNDFIFGQIGNDTVNGGAGNDNLWGNEQNDTITDPSGTNVINAGPGDDNVTGGVNADTIYGDGNNAQGGNDTLNGGLGTDLVIGFAGNDTITANDGIPDTVNGGPGADTCTTDPPAIDTVFNCNP